MTLDLGQLNAFVAVCDHGSVGRAAEHLHITQPALSRAVKRLEARLGVPLFERHSTGMALTSYGQALLPHAKLLREEAAQAAEEINVLRGLSKGTIRVGAVASVASGMLPLVVEQVLARRPQLGLRIVEGVGDVLADALVRHEIDLAIGVALPDNHEIAPVAGVGWYDKSCVIASSTHPLMKRRGLRLEHTLQHRWVMPPRTTAPFAELRQLLASHGLGLPNIVAETRSIIATKSLVAKAGFLGWMAQPMFEAEHAAGLIDALPISDAVMPRRLSVFRRRGGLLPAPATELLDELRRMSVP
jgi:DNA-binding transcriptional LysR family regulator